MDNAAIQAEFERLQGVLSKRELAKLADMLIVKSGLDTRNPTRKKAAEQYRKHLYGERAHWPKELTEYAENGI